MNKKPDIENQIRKTMAMLDAEDALPPDPNFYTHVKGRLRDHPESRSLGSIFKPLLLSALVVFNLITAMRYMANGVSAVDPDSEPTGINLFSEDLNLTDNQSDLFNF